MKIAHFEFTMNNHNPIFVLNAYKVEHHPGKNNILLCLTVQASLYRKRERERERERHTYRQTEIMQRL